MIQKQSYLFLIVLLSASFVHAQITQSILNNGLVYKIAVAESGVYRLDQSFLNENNISASIDQMHLYGQEGGMLPEPIAEPRSEDLIEIPVLKTSQGDLIFYVEGGDRWVVDGYNVAYEKNVFDIQNYIFLKIENSAQLELLDHTNTTAAEYITNTYDEFQRYEVDKINPLGLFPTTHGSGQEWYGDEFSNLRSKNYIDQFDFEGIVPEEGLRLQSVLVARSEVPTSYSISIDGDTYDADMSSVRTGDVEAIHARKGVIDAEYAITGTPDQIILDYPRVSATSQAWLDYIQVQFRKELGFNGIPMILRDLGSWSAPFSAFEIMGSSSPTLYAWNITEPLNPKNVEIANSKITYKSDEKLQTFLLFEEANVPRLSAPAELVPNQNLHGILDVDMIIVYHQSWRNEAERLAAHRSDHSGLLVEAVDVQWIYNEFSGGRQDPTAIRDFAKMLYTRSENFKFLLLFGDGSYDFRNIGFETKAQSFVPTYETKETLDPLLAFPSDDYFGLLSDDEGINLLGELDIAIGRLPARIIEEANNLVNKIISYDKDKNTLGAWRSRIAFLADDEDSNLHLNDADEIANNVKRKHPLFNQKKIYWDAFTQESTPGGNRYPAANEQLNNEIEEGLLVVNYLGHGGPKGWSQERVLNLDDILAWSNAERLPLVITATCSFTGFDDPTLTTAGEATIHNPSGGAIALFTTVRSVYASQNFRLTKAVFDTIFTQIDGQYMPIGEVLRRAKVSTVGSIANARKFLLIGDPSMQLAIPSYHIVTEEFNGHDVLSVSTADTIGALQKVTLSASVRNEQGDVYQSFNGLVDVTLFDKESELRTLKNDPTSFQKTFELQKNILFRGTANVTNGRFEISFIVPLDIDYSYGPGRLSYYATSNAGSDAAGYYDEFIIGGTAQNAINDDLGPEITIVLNNDNFKNGDQTRGNPLVMATLSDDSGINVSNVSIGHEIIGILDDNSRTIDVLNEKYISDVDDFTEGRLSYRLEDLTPGFHTLTIRAFDILNNPGQSTIEFEVVDGVAEYLQNVYAFPNPFSDQTQFSIENEIGGAVDLTVNIFDLSGRLVHQITKNRLTNQDTFDDITWRVVDGAVPVGNGVYVYEVLLESVESDKSVKSGLKKLIVIK